MDRSYEILASGPNVFRPFEDDFSDLRGIRIGVDTGGQTQVIDVIPDGGPFEFAADFGEALFEALEALPSLIDVGAFAVSSVNGVSVSVGDVIPLGPGGVVLVGEDGLIFDPGDEFDLLSGGEVVSFEIALEFTEPDGTSTQLSVPVDIFGSDTGPTEFAIPRDSLLNVPEDVVANVRVSDGNVTTGGQIGDSLIIDFLTFDVFSVEPILADGATGTFTVVEVAPFVPDEPPQQFALLAFGGGGRDATEDQLGFVTAGRDLEPGFARRPTENADKIRGTGGADEIDMLGGDDTVFGDNGNDELNGGSGADEIDGGGGNDLIDGGPGDDTLIGQSGTDTYLFTGEFGRDVVEDQGRSVLEFDANAVLSFARDVDDLVISASGGVVTVDSYFRAGGTIEVREGDVPRAINLAPEAINLTDASVAEDAEVGAFVARAQVRDEDDAVHTLGLAGPGAETFFIDGRDIRLASELDFETTPRYDLALTATDPAGNSITRDIVIFVEDVEEDGGGNGGGQLGQGLSVEEAREVALLYEAGLDRDGNIDLPGLNFWIDAREDGLTQRQLARAFLQSAEFNESFGEPFDTGDPRYLDDLAFVRALYENVLDRGADQPGLDFWRSVLDRTEVGRPDLLLAFARSDENVDGSPAVATLNEVAEGEWAFVG